MEKTKVQNYMNPITFEAEMFVNSLKELSTTYNQFDVNLVNSLEKVMLAIETFLDQSKNEIVPTENTKLVTCDIMHIKRIYHCSSCKTDLGKSVEKVALHLTTQCGQGGGSKQSSEANFGGRAAGETGAKNRDGKSSSDVRREKRLTQADKRVAQTVKLTKKTKSLLTADLDLLFVDMVKISEKLKCIPEYAVIEKELLVLITPLFPNQTVKVYKFGSRLSGIGTRDSDLDLFIDIGDTFNTYENRTSKDTLKKLYKVRDALKIHPESWKCLVQIDKARVPILKITHGTTFIECDINFSNSLGNINTQFFEYIFKLQPIARLLCMFLKKWINRIQLNIYINTYTIILMVTFYLQNLDVLPAVEKLQQSIKPEKAATVGPWLCSYATLTLNQLNIPLADVSNENVSKFIQGFFEFYINFNFETELVCPYLGKKIKREDFNKLMPDRYTTYIQTSADYALQLNKPVVVQDPIQLNHNVTKGLSLMVLQVLKCFMSKSLEVLKYGNKTTK